MTTALETLIEQARTGDYQAFTDMVNRFQRMAYATAFAMLNDHQTTEEVVQEAFIEAYCHLNQLRIPAAFPGWFRRIVIKQADRITRRPSVRLQPVETAYDLATPYPGPESLVEKHELASIVWQVVSTLSEPLQEAVILFYVYGYTQPEIADFLGVPVGTVKKRLYDARQQLGSHQLIVQHHLAPSVEHLSKRVAFFVALRWGDVERVTQLLIAFPELVSARTHWEMDIGGGYWPHHFTALHWAAAAGDEALLRRLLERGSHLEATTRSGMTPLHIAVLMGHFSIVQILLNCNASVSTVTQTGLTAFDLADIRGHKTIQLALAVNSRASSRSPFTRTQGEFSISNLKSLSRTIAGRTLSPDEVETLMNGPLVFDTGIKLIDLLAPMQAGGVNAIYTPQAGVGKLVVVGEIIYRMAIMEGGNTICIGMQSDQGTADDLMNGWREMGVWRYLTQFVAENPAQVEQTITAALTVTVRLLREGQSHMLLVLDAALASEHQKIKDVMDDLAPGQMLTVLYYGHELPDLPANELATHITFSLARAKAGLWPAIDPVQSTSSLLESPAVSDTHRQIVEQARMRLAEHDPSIGHTHLSDFFTQPFFVAAPWTGLDGEYVAIDDRLEMVSGFLDGHFADQQERPFYAFGATQTKR